MLALRCREIDVTVVQRQVTKGNPRRLGVPPQAELKCRLLVPMKNRMLARLTIQEKVCRRLGDAG